VVTAVAPAGVGVAVVVSTGVAVASAGVAVTVGTGPPQVVQHESTIVPPRFVHLSADESGRQRPFGPGAWQFTLPSRFPQVERIEQPLILPRQLLEMVPS
jgi:hypothetical protein